MMTTLPAGKYWIGDPCYVFPDEGHMESKWDELLDVVEFFKTPYGELDNGKIKVWAASTAYGDGCYTANNGKTFRVDAGLLGIVPQETVDYLGRTDSDLDYSGLFIEFTEPFIVQHNAGVFNFGHIEIDTGDDYDADEDDGLYDENYDDEDDIYF